MLASVSSSIRPTGPGRATAPAEAIAAPKVPAGARPMQVDSVRPVLPAPAKETMQAVTRARLANLLLPADRTNRDGVRDIPEGTMSRAPTAQGAQASGDFRIPTRITLEIQKARDAIAETGGGLRAMQVFMQELARQRPPSISRMV